MEVQLTKAQHAAVKETARATVVDMEKFHEAVKLGMQDAEDI